jgi:saccharopine dehydrogenase (NAD+, L-lysine forming)
MCRREKCIGKVDAIAKDVKKRYKRKLATATVDADDSKAVAKLIEQHKADIVVNVALPYQDLTIMDGCLEAGAHYIDTANYEPLDTAKFEYKWQWAYKKKFEKAGLMALLGAGFDPGQTNIYCAHALKHEFDEIETVDIVDCNGGSNGLPFATNFNPEINIREVTAKGRFFRDGKFHETEPMAIHTSFDFPGVGEKEMYLLYHEELESLCKNIPGVKQMRFWMTFSQNYLKHLEVLQNVGMTGIKPIKYEGVDIVPLQFLKAVLPDPGSLGAKTVGKTSIGCIVTGKKKGKTKHFFIYNICDHEECNEETGAQAVSYTTGVPCALATKLLAEGTWLKKGVWNIEQMDPDPFMSKIGAWGLPWETTTFKKNPLEKIRH